MRGKCLCGAIEFELLGKPPNLYQCHCSLCRKVTGSSANAACRVDADRFAWTRGKERIRKYVSESGFKSHFCANCGSPVPNLTSNDKAYWIPAGLLEDNGELELVAHLYVESKASWDVISDGGTKFAEMPDTEALDRLLQPPESVG